MYAVEPCKIEIPSNDLYLILPLQGFVDLPLFTRL